MQNITLAKKNREELQPKIIYFPRGLLGMENIHKFYYSAVENSDCFFLLQAVEKPGWELLTVVPFYFFPDYTLELTEKDKKDLNVEELADFRCHTIVSEEDNTLCTNLAAPVLINPVRHRGKQIILPERSEEIRKKIFI